MSLSFDACRRELADQQWARLEAICAHHTTDHQQQQQQQQQHQHNNHSEQE
jgi:hypothetical protein